MMHRYHPFRLTLRAPALLTGLDGDPNSAFTLDHVPGSVLRGVVAGRLDPAAREAFRALVLDGAVRYLHAWPVRDDRRGVPVPVSFREAKGAHPSDRMTVHDLAAFDGVPRDDHSHDDTVWPEENLAASRSECATLGASDIGLVAARRSSRVHQQRDRVRGRAWTERKLGKERAVGTIFTYESLDADQTFEGLVLVEGPTAEVRDARFAIVKTALQGALLLGRSRRAGYGGDATLEWRPPRDREIEGSRILAGPVKAGSLFRALFTSPCLARSEVTGQIDPAALPRQLEARLGDRARVIRRRWGFTTVGGFNRHWGLELPQALMVAAGSVLVLEAMVDISRDDLLTAEHEGLGERRIEGFGRMCFLEAPEQTLTLRAQDNGAPMPIPVPDQPVPALVAWLEQRVLAQHLETRIAEASEEIAASAKSPPTNSLLGRLRVPLRGDPSDALKTLRVWLGDGADALRRPARAQLDRCRVEASQKRQPLSAWITAVLDRDAGKDALQINALVQRRRLVSEESARKWLEARSDAWRVRLLDATLAAIAVKRARGPK
jgi:CRISPR-associated protein Csx10